MIISGATKRGQKLLARASHNEGTELYQVYGNISSAKMRAMENCKRWCYETNGRNNTSKLKNMKISGFKVAVIPILYYKNTRLSKAVKRLFIEADKAYSEGANILILSDRGVDENHLAIPSLLAVSALHQHLVVTKRRTSLAIVLESGEPREVHHFATLLGYGASAINPYLAHEAIAINSR